jgi:arginine/ornithine N-succinyltransferase beta subunit
LPESYRRADVLAKLSKSAQSYDFDSLSREAEQILKSRGAAVGVQRLAKVAEDQNAIYLAMLENVDQNGQVVTSAGIVGGTLLRHPLVSYNIYSDYRNEATYAGLQQAAKDVLAAVVASNPE